MGNERQSRSVDDASPSWMTPAAEKIDAVLHPRGPELSCTEAADDPCKDSKDAIAAVFAFMYGHASNSLNKLREDLKRSDKPSWTEQLLDGLFEVSFLAGGARTGEYLVHKLGHKFEQEAKLAAEFIKKALEEGAPAGASVAKDQLKGTRDPDPDEFILAQQFGVGAMYQNAAEAFLFEGRHQLRSSTSAVVLRRSLSAEHLIAAASQQYDASLDAYLTCLAQQTLGARRDPDAMAQQGRTNMRTASAAGVMLGIDRGVLQVQVMLCDDVRREPYAWNATLNGVNDGIREQYVDVPLASLHIPRVLTCLVRGDTPDFAVTIDETGAMRVTQGTPEWLEARARAESTHATGETARRRGLELLLGDLRIEGIGKGGFS